PTQRQTIGLTSSPSALSAMIARMRLSGHEDCASTSVPARDGYEPLPAASLIFLKQAPRAVGRDTGAMLDWEFWNRDPGGSCGSRALSWRARGNSLFCFKTRE